MLILPARKPGNRVAQRMDHYDRLTSVGRRLVLWAEMRLPGVAWLEWTVEPVDGGSVLVQTARFRPRGLLGRAYWYEVAPFHRLVFPGRLDGIARDAVAHPA